MSSPCGDVSQPQIKRPPAATRDRDLFSHPASERAFSLPPSLHSGARSQNCTRQGRFLLGLLRGGRSSERRLSQSKRPNPNLTLFGDSSCFTVLWFLSLMACTAQEPPRKASPLETVTRDEQETHAPKFQSATDQLLTMQVRWNEGYTVWSNRQLKYTVVLVYVPSDTELYNIKQIPADLVKTQAVNFNGYQWGHILSLQAELQSVFFYPGVLWPSQYLYKATLSAAIAEEPPSQWHERAVQLHSNWVQDLECAQENAWRRKI